MSKRNTRLGMSTVEVSVAAALLALAAVSMTTMLSLVAGQQRSSQRETIAALEAGNILDRTYAIPYDELASGPLPFAPSSSFTALESGTVSLQVTEQSDPQRKQITVQIQWLTKAGNPMYRPVSISTWRYAEEESP